VPHGDCLSRTILRRDQREIVFRLSAAGLDAHKAGLPKSMSFGRGGAGRMERESGMRDDLRTTSSTQPSKAPL
jgi:hypothetical protein